MQTSGVEGDVIAESALPSQAPQVTETYVCTVVDQHRISLFSSHDLPSLAASLRLSLPLCLPLCRPLPLPFAYSHSLLLSLCLSRRDWWSEILRVCVRKRVDRCASMSSGRRRSLHLILLHSDTFGRQWSSEDDSSVSLLLLVESESVLYHAVQRANFGREHV